MFWCQGAAGKMCMSGKMYVTVLQQQLELDQGKYISDCFCRLHGCSLTGHIALKGTGRWLGHSRRHLEDGSWAPGKGQGHPWSTQRPQRLLGHKEILLGLEVDDLWESLPIQTGFWFSRDLRKCLMEDLEEKTTHFSACLHIPSSSKALGQAGHCRGCSEQSTGTVQNIKINFVKPALGWM